ncbi:MAG: hypothetical protein HY069_02300, partial [Chlamydiia bacterium]|nr:hypothetical protein [Chlamydiia bacterium]
ELFPAVAIERIVQELEKARLFSKLRLMLLGLAEFGLLEVIFPSLQGTPLTEIEKRLAPTHNYPAKALLITQLLPLFPPMTLDEQMALCQMLKLSNLDQQFVTFLFHAFELLHTKRSIALSEWAYFYANTFAPVSLQIVAAHTAHPTHFLQEHEKRMELLKRSIERIHRHDPVVKSGDLLKAGIRPGKAMGHLLREADRISIDEQIEESAAILERLKQLPEWGKF